MISVVVFAAPGRDVAHERTFASIHASDIGRNYIVSMHETGVERDEHWRRTHMLAAAQPTDLVLVLEDDVLVNRHILANIASWRWPLRPEFGAGWVYNPGRYSTKDVWYRGPRAWAMTPGVVYKTASLPRQVDLAMGKMQAGMPWDCAIAWAVHDAGRRIRVHYPSLVEHQNDVPSKLGNPSKSVLRTSRGTYDETWQRPPSDPNALYDRHGRIRLGHR
jgi:hypothetical protein